MIRESGALGGCVLIEPEFSSVRESRRVDVGRLAVVCGGSVGRISCARNMTDCPLRGSADSYCKEGA